MDFSDSVYIASEKYKNFPNLYFVKGDIADTNIKNNSVDYVNCDQVIHHTENPEKTFAHLSSLLTISGEFACYVYAKKALPRELLDECFRQNCKNLSKEELWQMSESLTILGKTLSDLNISINVPDILALNIKGGEYDLQRFIYWNFIKCFWNEELGFKNSVSTNFDWYAPSNAKRYSEEEFTNIINENFLKIMFFHKEEACFSGRFKKLE
jgi:SAM-dependent methyltransferase